MNAAPPKMHITQVAQSARRPRCRAEPGGGGEKAECAADRVKREEWAGPGGTAIPGQPVAKAEQAPDTSPCSKNQFNIVVSQWETYQILS